MQPNTVVGKALLLLSQLHSFDTDVNALYDWFAHAFPSGVKFTNRDSVFLTGKISQLYNRSATRRDHAYSRLGIRDILLRL